MLTAMQCYLSPNLQKPWLPNATDDHYRILTNLINGKIYRILPSVISSRQRRNGYFASLRPAQNYRHLCFRGGGCYAL